MNKAIIELLNELTPEEGFNDTDIPGVTLFRTTKPIMRMVNFYDPCLVFVAQRQKIGYIGGERFLYDPGHYLVVATSLPLETNVEASIDDPFLAITIPLEYDVMADLLGKMEMPAGNHESSTFAIYAEAVTEELLDASHRLLLCMRTRTDAKILGLQIVREIIYRVTQGPRAKLLFDIFSNHNSQMQIARSLRFIHENFQKKLDVEWLADQEGISVSSFHAKFKMVTSQAPMQYIKCMRLKRARDLIALRGFASNAAAYHVGYESTSQFSREFKRYFGYTPKESKSNYPIVRNPTM